MRYIKLYEELLSVHNTHQLGWGDYDNIEISKDEYNKISSIDVREFTKEEKNKLKSLIDTDDYLKIQFEPITFWEMPEVTMDACGGMKIYKKRLSGNESIELICLKLEDEWFYCSYSGGQYKCDGIEGLILFIKHYFDI